MQAGSLLRGDELRRNYAVNPSFETNELNWVNGAGGVRTQISTNPYVGAKCLQVTYAAAGTFKYVGQSTVIQPGKSYIKTSVAVRRIAGAGFAKMRVGYRDHPTTGALTYGPLSDGQPITGSWSILTIEHAIPATTQHLVVIVYAADTAAGTSVVAGSSWAIDAMDISLGINASDTPDPNYFDGSTSTPGHVNEWEGEPHQSASIQYEAMSEDVRSYRSRILVNGVARDAIRWNVDRDLNGDLPEQVASGAGITQATGSVEWGTVDPVTKEVHPWDPSSGWIPLAGDRVEILAGNGVSEWSQFVGVIDDATGAVGEYGVASKIIDNIDKFSIPVNLPALLDAMPPMDTGVPRRIRLTPRFYLATAMRRAGYYVTPPDEDGCVLSMPGIGSMWPLVGTLVRSRRTTAPDASPLSGATFMQDATADYEPSVARAATVSTSITLCVPAGMTGVVAVTCSYGANSFALRVGGGNVSARINGALTISADRTGATILQVLMRDGKIRLRSNTGLDQTATASTGSGSTAMSNIQVYADGDGQFSGVQVAHPAVGREFSALNFAPSAIIGTGMFHEALAAGRATEDKTAKELLDEIGQALLTPFWIDEAGIARAVASDVLRSRPPVRTLTTLDDVKTLSWRRDLLGTRTRVSANYEAATVNRRADYSLEVWASNEATVLDSNETHDTLIETPADEAWIMVNEGLTVPGVSSLTAANKGVGTLAGGLYTDGVNEQWAVLPADVLTVNLARIKQGVWRIRHTTKTLAAGKQVELRTWSSTFSGRTELWPYWWDKELPRLRAKALVKFVDKTFGPVTAGKVGPELTHDCKSWATGNLETNETTVISNIVNFIAQHVTNPEPVIEGLEIVYDPRLQLGDVVTVSSPSLLGVEFRCLIVGVNLNADDSYAQTLKVRIISVTQTGVTYKQFADAWGNTASYETFNTAWSAISTYTDFNNDPLEGA